MEGEYVMNVGGEVGRGGKEIGEKLGNELGIGF